MNLSSMMAGQVTELRRTLNLNMMSSQMATQAAHATVMLEDFTQAQATTTASHPTLGNQIDIKG
jgi:hypothetical protein